MADGYNQLWEVPHDPPVNYVAPRSWEELLKRYEKGERFFGDAQLPDSPLMRVTLSGAYFGNANFERCIFLGSTLAGCQFYGASFKDADLTDADLSGSNMACSDVSGARLIRTNL